MSSVVSASTVSDKFYREQRGQFSERQKEERTDRTDVSAEQPASTTSLATYRSARSDTQPFRTWSSTGFVAASRDGWGSVFVSESITLKGTRTAVQRAHLAIARVSRPRIDRTLVSWTSRLRRD